MPAEVTPIKLQNVVKRGFERLQSYRKARALFMREYVGQYYRDKYGVTGDEPLNLIFRTVSTFVPNLVTQSGVNDVSTDFLAFKPYAEMLGLALDKIEGDINLKDTLRAWIVSAIFAFGIIKTSLASSENLIQYGDKCIDPGQVYSEIVDLDDFVFDPVCTEMNKSAFMGSRIRVPRAILLDTDGYDHDEVAKLPQSKFYGGLERIEDLTKANTSVTETYALQDYVDVVELHVPEADALVTMPDPQQTMTGKHLRVADYYGPKEGPYTLLSFTPPVPNNPLPLAPVSMWYDIHKIANRTFKRMMNQTDREKSVLAYSPMNADEAADLVDADDGDSIAVTDPTAFNILQWGGSNPKNDQMVQQMQMWFNYMSGNPDQMSGNQTRGTTGKKETATKTAAMQSNAAVGLEDARSIIYDRSAEISGKQAWFLHHDPLINLPLVKRLTGGKYQQLELTPEQRQGDFLDFVFKIRARSMVPLDPLQRTRLMTEFAVNIVPAVTNAAMVAMQMKVPFNLMRCITDLAEAQGLTTDVQSWFEDPEFEAKIRFMTQMGPQNPGKAGGMGPGSTEQNNGSPTARPVAGPETQNNQNAQMGANGSQQTLPGGM
ncbi:MAG: hypothetical protein FVQ80_11100 [Planctomycetes bacterium]|nr:hypothetical protein [Planctomycetota bacterium]